MTEPMSVNIANEILQFASSHDQLARVKEEYGKWEVPWYEPGVTQSPAQRRRKRINLRKTWPELAELLDEISGVNDE